MKIAIFGYGNIARGVESAVKQNDDVTLYGVFTRRDPETVKTVSGAKVFPASEIISHKGKFDVLVVCGGSATDLPVLSPKFARDFNIVDSFDTHPKIPSFFAAVDESAAEGGNVAVISGGWDPGLFSLNRLYSSAVLPDGKDYTFWGRGVSQGHSDAIRHVDGVADARQYTVPIEEAVNSVRSGNCPEFKTSEKHRRECYVVLKDGADPKKVEAAIKSMPDYFADYDTTVHFISAEELKEKHSGLPHGGFVIRTGKTGFNLENTHTVEYSLKLDSNPEFTGSVLVALARAADRMSKRGETGCRTIFDIPPAFLSPLTPEEQRAKYL
ncbi:MAG: diaminopimelate dehydrogenase [Clostridia bacterium]|nr:diaminopimelate dehydrogenase [Clostridia bacterium]